MRAGGKDRTEGGNKNCVKTGIPLVAMPQSNLVFAILLAICIGLYCLLYLSWHDGDRDRMRTQTDVIYRVSV